MEAVFEAFGVDWRLIIIQIFNFAILLGLLWYFLYTPLLRVLSERQSKIEQGIRDAEAAETAKNKAESEGSRVVEEAHKKAEEVVEHGTVRAKEKESQILDEAKTKAAAIAESAKAAGEAEKARLLKESEAEVAKTAVLAAEKILKGEK
jgi:F-type H+-transporting ATPase subunit b